MWVGTLPTPEQFAQACPASALDDGHTLEIRNATTGDLLCTLAPDQYTNWTYWCNVSGRVDDYYLQFMAPAGEQVACALTTQHRTPGRGEWAQVCPQHVLEMFDQGNVEVRLIKEEAIQVITYTPPLPPIPTPGAGLLEQPASPTELATDIPLTWLAGRFIWYGMVYADCPSGALTPEGHATACGMEAARHLVRDWQNQFDVEIYHAAKVYNVPPRLLKAILLKESQLWPLWVPGSAGEVGPMQATLHAADVLARWQNLPGYINATPERTHEMQVQIQNGLHCINCTVNQAADHLRATMPQYAALLAAYYAHAGGDWRAALTSYNGQPYADSVLSTY
jgi:hypothetical protein